MLERGFGVWLEGFEDTHRTKSGSHCFRCAWSWAVWSNMPSGICRPERSDALWMGASIFRQPSAMRSSLPLAHSCCLRLPVRCAHAMHSHSSGDHPARLLLTIILSKTAFVAPVCFDDVGAYAHRRREGGIASSAQLLAGRYRKWAILSKVPRRMAVFR
jgi:hypothetical protein